MLIVYIIILVVLILLVVYLVFVSGKWPKHTKFSIDFQRVRNLAGDQKEAMPERINMLVIATGKLPNWAVSAGDFTKGTSKIEFPCFQLVYKDKTSIIEAPYSKNLFDKFPFGDEYYQDNYERMQEALLEAEFIIPTHEHWDHLGGIAQSKYIDKILNKTILTLEQINGPTIKDAEFPVGILENYEPLAYDDYYRVSPGIVLIKAPGHSVGHQFVYVQLKNGEEFLFTGDVLWVGNNFKTRKNRPWITSKKRLENRAQISHQMKYLHDNFYYNTEQKIYMLSTHDLELHNRYIKEGLIHEGIRIQKEQEKSLIS